MLDPAPARKICAATCSFAPDAMRATGGAEVPADPIDVRDGTSHRYWLADARLMRSLPPAAWTLFRLAEHKRGGTATHMWRVGSLTWRFAQALGIGGAKKI